MSIIDISVPLYEGMPVWPGSVGLHREWVKRIDRGDKSNDSTLNCDVHLGTHVDAPLHFVENGKSVELLLLDVLCGPVFVADLTSVDAITEKDLALLDLSDGVERLLLKTKNSKLWNKSRFNPDYVALTEDGTRWIVKSGIKLVGIDYLSIGPFKNNQPVHRILLEAGVVVVEGLNLVQVQKGQYELICLPLKLTGSEGAPARAILRNLKQGSL